MPLERTRVFAIFPTMEHPESYTSCLGATLYTDHRKAQKELNHRHFMRVSQIEEFERDDRWRVESDLDAGIYWTWASGDDVFLPYGAIDLSSKGFTPAAVPMTGWALLTEDEVTIIGMEHALLGATQMIYIDSLH